MPEFTADDGVKLHYLVRGKGSLPILYLHWMGGDGDTWKGVWAALHPQRYRHIALDFRGHGQSDGTRSTFTNDRLARDVICLADELGIRRFVLAGHSFGGKVALRVAAMVPARVIGLVLVGTVGPGKIPLERESLEPLLTRTKDIAYVRECFRPWFTVWPRAELDGSLESFVRTPAWAHRAVCEIALWTDITRDIGEIAALALVIAGKHDPVYGPSYQREAVLPAVPRATLVTIPCGHGLILELPEAIAGHCEPFLMRCLRA